MKEIKMDIVPGFHSVMETLVKKPSAIKEIYVSKEKSSKRIEKIIDIAHQKNIPVNFIDISEFALRFSDVSHQGVLALLREFRYHNLEDIIATKYTGLEDRNLSFIALDHITDEGNLGSIIRTASFFGVDGIIIPKDRSAGITPRVLKSCSGAHNLIPVIKVVNLVRSLRLLDKKGFWIIGTGTKGRSIYEFDWNMDKVLVLGNEQKGLSPGVKKVCHDIAEIPSQYGMESLNVAVAAGVILGEIFRQNAHSSH